LYLERAPGCGAGIANAKTLRDEFYDRALPGQRDVRNRPASEEWATEGITCRPNVKAEYAALIAPTRAPPSVYSGGWRKDRANRDRLV